MNDAAPAPPTSDLSTSPTPTPIERYRRAAASDEEIYEFPITPLDHTDVPVWVVGQWQEDGELLTGVGYGETDERARIGAWGEMIEQVANHRALGRLPRRTGSYAELQKEGVPAIDPLRLRLPVTTDYAPERALQWVEARRYRPDVRPEEHERIWVPVEAAAAHFFDLGDEGPENPLFTPITNGLGAGDTFERALAHGLLELVQRDGNSAAYRALDRGIALDLDTVSDPDLRALLGRFDEAGLDVLVKLAATDFDMVNLYVVGRERDPSAAPHPIMLTGCGEAAHPDREVALGKALREYAASRVRKRFTHGPLERVLPLLPDGYRERIFEDPAAIEESQSLEAMREWVRLDPEETLGRIEGSILRVDHRVPFSSLPTVPPGSLASPPDVLAAVARRIMDEGLEIFYVDLTPEGAAACAVKAIVPGLEVETMTYGRIGPRNLRRLLERIEAGDPVVPHDLVGFGDPPPGARRIPMTEADEAALGGPVWFSVERAEEALSDLYAMYREPDFHLVALTEGKEVFRV